MLVLIFLLSTLFITFTLFYNRKHFYEAIASTEEILFLYIMPFKPIYVLIFWSAPSIRVTFVIFFGTLEKTLFNTQILEHFIEVCFHKFHTVFFLKWKPWMRCIRSPHAHYHISGYVEMVSSVILPETLALESWI